MRLFPIFLLFILVACQSDNPSIKTIDMFNADGDMVGTATLSEASDGVTVKIKVEGLSPGFHGIHLHEKPTCEGPDFQTAGNHFNPEGKQHGLLHPEGPHLGDMPNVEADGSGLVDTELTIQGATLLDGKNSILQEGTSLIITEGQDDGMSQPGGNSGKRLICGEIKADPEQSSDGSPTDPTELKDSESGE